MQPDHTIRQWVTENRSQLLLVAIVLLSAVTLLWGIEKDLPFSPEADESIYVERAIRMASLGDPNPRWFGNPGSTTFYPLAAMYHTWHALRYRGTFFRPDANLLVRYHNSTSEFFLIGRLLSVTFAVATIFCVYKIGQNAFESRAVGLTSAGLSILYPVTISHSQWVRTDTSALFFGMLALWLCLLLYASPTIKFQLLAGIAIGLAIASRYFMITLAPVYVAANLMAFLRVRSSGVNLLTAAYWISAGLVAAALTFVLSTPYFFLNFATVVQNLRVEARSTQLGWDGLSALGNLNWYLTQAIPQNITLPQMVLAIVGAVIAVVKREPKPVLLLTYIAAFLFAISASPLHWERWVIQILPLFSLFAVYGMFALIAIFFSSSTRVFQNNLAAAGVVMLFLLPLVGFGLSTIGRTGPSTRVLAREWSIKHLPSNSKIVTDKEAAPLVGLSFEVYEQSWAPPDRRLDEYVTDGYQYIIINEVFHNFFLAEADRYASQLQFYENLQREAELLIEIEPSLTNEGGAIRIYGLPAGAAP